MAAEENSNPPAGMETEENSPIEESTETHEGEANIPAETENTENSEGEEAENSEEEGSDSNEGDETPITRRKARELRSEARNLRAKNKGLTEEITTLQTRLEEAENKLAETTAKIAEVETSSVKNELKARFGFSDAQMKYISGSNKEELENSAKEFYEALTPAGVSGLKVSGGKTSSPVGDNLSDAEIIKKFKR